MDNYQVGLEIITGAKIDKGSVNKAISVFDKMIENADFDKIDFDIDPAEIENAYKQIEKDTNDLIKIIDDLNITMDNEEAKKAIAEIEKQIEGLNQIDLTKFEKALDGLDINDIDKMRDKLSDAMDNFDTKKAQQNWKNLSSEFEKAQSETADLLRMQKLALAEMERTGQQGSKAYDDLQKEIKQTEASVKEYADSLALVGEGIDDIANESFTDIFSKFEALGNLAGQLGSFGEGGVSLRQTLREVQAQTGLTADEMERLKVSAQNAFKAGVGDSVNDMVKAFGYSQQLLGDFLNPQQLEEFTTGAGQLAQVFDKDINEVIAGSRTAIAAWGKDGQEALDLIAYTARETGSKMDDTFDTWDEYSQLARDAGMSMEQMAGTITTAMEKGTRDTDKVMDSLKEFGIRVRAGDFVKPMEDIVNATQGMEKQVALSVKNSAKAAMEGKIPMYKAMTEIAKTMKDAMDAGQIGQTLAEQLSVAVSGTMSEDIGVGLWSDIFSAPIDTEAIKAKGAQISSELNDAIVPETAWQKFTKSFKVVADDIVSSIAPIYDTGVKSLESIAGIAPALLAFKEYQGTIKNAALSISHFFVPSLITAESVQGKATLKTVAHTVATKAQIVAQKALNTIMKMNPWGAALAGVAAIAAGYFALKDSALEAAEAQRELVEGQQNINDRNIEHTENLLKQKEYNLTLIDTYDDLASKENKTDAEKQKLIKTVRELNKIYPNAQVTTDNYTTSVSELKTAALGTNEEITKLKKELNDLQNNKINLDAKKAWADVKVLREELNELQEDSGDGGFDLFTSIAAFDSKEAGAKLQQVYNEMLNAVDLTEMQNKSTELQNLLLNSDFYMNTLDKEDRDAFEKKLLDFEQARIDAYQAEETKYQKLVENNIAATLGAYQSANQNIAEIQSAQSEGLITDKQKTDLELWEKARTKYLNEILTKTKGLSENGEEQVKLVKKMTEEYGLSNEETAKIYDNLDTTESKAEYVKIKFSEVNEKIIDAAVSSKQMKDEIAENDEALAAIKALGVEFENVYHTAEFVTDIMKAAYEKGKELNEQSEKEVENSNKSKKAAESKLQIANKEYALKVKSQDKLLNEYKLYGEIAKTGDKELDDKLKKIALTDKEIEKTEALKQEMIDIYGLKIDENGKVLSIGIAIDKNKGETADDVINGYYNLIQSLQNQIDSNEDLKLQLGVSAEGIAQARIELDKSKLQYQIELGFGDRSQLVSILNSELNEIESELSRKQGELSDILLIDEKERSQAQIAQLALLQTQIMALQAKQFDKLKEVNSQKQTLYDEELEILQNKFDRQKEIMQAELDEMQATYDRLNTISLDATKSKISDDTESELNSIAEKEEKALKRLETAYNDGLKSKEAYEKEKAALQDKYEKQRQDAQEIARKAELVAEKIHSGKQIFLQRDLLEKEKEAAQKNLDEFIKAKADSDDEFGDPIFGNAADKAQFDALRSNLLQATEILNSQGDEMQVAWDTLTNISQDSIVAYFAGSDQAFKEGGRNFLSTMVGFLEALAAETVAELVLNWLKEFSWFDGSILAKLATAPAMASIFGSIINTALSPLTSKMLTSFATGGYVENPTVALVGDAGTNNPEWILNNEQMKKLLSETASQSGGNAEMLNQLKRINYNLESLELKTKTNARDIETILNRNQYKKSKKNH